MTQEPSYYDITRIIAVLGDWKTRAQIMEMTGMGRGWVNERGPLLELDKRIEVRFTAGPHGATLYRRVK